MPKPTSPQPPGLTDEECDALRDDAGIAWDGRGDCLDDTDYNWESYLIRAAFAAGCEAQRKVDADRPTIVTLCGSTRFYETWQQAIYDETMAGRMVFSVGFYPHAAEKAHAAHVGCTPEQKKALDVLHFRKIDQSDEILVLNVGGYIGESTRNEINHAKATGKRIRYLEPAAIERTPEQPTTARCGTCGSDDPAKKIPLSLMGGPRLNSNGEMWCKDVFHSQPTTQTRYVCNADGCHYRTPDKSGAALHNQATGHTLRIVRSQPTTGEAKGE